MAQVRVNPDSVTGYARTAQTNFDTVRTQFVNLVNDVVNVHYFGPNAVQFKTHCGQMSADFAQRLSQDMGQIADAVRVSTSNIASALGGQPISINVNGSTITVPDVPQGDGSVDINTEGLSGLIPTVNGHCETIKTQFQEHFNALQRTDWLGTAKESAVTAVGNFTKQANAKVDEARDAITRYINDQIHAVQTADK